MQRAVAPEVWVTVVFLKTDHLTVTDVENKLRKTLPIAHPTRQTTLDRMYQTGYLIREKQGKALVYSTRYSRD